MSKFYKTCYHTRDFQLDKYQKCTIPVGTVIARIWKMEQEGIIKGDSAILDVDRLGYDLTAITEITVFKGKLLGVEQEIVKIPNCCVVYDVTGLTDTMMIVKSKKRKTLSDFGKTVLAMFFVERTNTHVVLTTVKENYWGFVNETSHGAN
ncbi:MAG: Lrp/AsnC family transcriptional regulator [Candidatus Heimdallarchaeota archaeon]